MGTIVYSSDNSYNHIIQDLRNVNPEQKDFAFTGIGYQKKKDSLYTESSGGKQFYIDPVNGSDSGDGSKKRPWKTLQQVIEKGLIETWNRPSGDPGRGKKPKNPGAPVKGGDVLVLKEGVHGSIYIRECYNNNYITIKAATGERPLIRSVYFNSAGKWRLDGLYITQEMNIKEFIKMPLINIESKYAQSENLDFYNNTVFSVWDSSKWSKENWNTMACNGMNLNGNYCAVKNNYFKNVDTGINIFGEHNNICNNTIKNFSGDGMRGQGNYLLFEKNLIKNVYSVNANHADGFQSFCIGKVTEFHHNTLIQNVIINYEDYDQPFRGQLQGIGCFDGFYRHWLVEKNLIVVDHYHGITFMGATDTIIKNNIVVDINNVKPGPVRISITPHKDKRPSKNCKITDNIAQKIIIATPNTNVTESDNRIISEKEKADLFTDFDKRDFTLKPAYASFLK